MRVEVNLCAYQLMVDDFIHWSNGWYRVLDLRGGYLRGFGLVVDILLTDGWHRIKYLTQFKVARHG